MLLFQEVPSTKLVKYEKYYFKYYSNTICGTYSGNKNPNEYGFCNVLGITKKNRREIPEWIIYINDGILSTYILIDFTKIKCYLKISKKDYNKKLREKYEQIVLKVILKKIVNEDFEWY